jgi:ABC-type multidrug transport system fused ATPase/permease subunit
MTGTEVTAIPFTAWQQAVFVVLIILFVAWVLSWMAKQNASTRDFQQSESDKWQKFIADLNENWRKFNREQREENNSRMSDVNQGLGNLTKVTEGLVMEVREMRTESREISAALALHDNQAKEILHYVQTNGKLDAKPLARANS